MQLANAHRDAACPGDKQPLPSPRRLSLGRRRGRPSLSLVLPGDVANTEDLREVRYSCSDLDDLFERSSLDGSPVPTADPLIDGMQQQMAKVGMAGDSRRT